MSDIPLRIPPTCNVCHRPTITRFDPPLVDCCPTRSRSRIGWFRGRRRRPGLALPRPELAECCPYGHGRWSSDGRTWITPDGYAVKPLTPEDEAAVAAEELRDELWWKQLVNEALRGQIAQLTAEVRRQRRTGDAAEPVGSEAAPPRPGRVLLWCEHHGFAHGEPWPGPACEPPPVYEEPTTEPEPEPEPEPETETRWCDHHGFAHEVEDGQWGFVCSLVARGYAAEAADFTRREVLKPKPIDAAEPEPEATSGTEEETTEAWSNEAASDQLDPVNMAGPAMQADPPRPGRGQIRLNVADLARMAGLDSPDAPRIVALDVDHIRMAVTLIVEHPDFPEGPPDCEPPMVRRTTTVTETWTSLGWR